MVRRPHVMYPNATTRIRSLPRLESGEDNLTSMAGMITGSRVLRGAVRSERRRVGIAGLLMCGHQAGEALVPVLVGVVIDAAVTTGDVGALVVWIAVLGLDFLFLS